MSGLHWTKKVATGHTRVRYVRALCRIDCFSDLSTNAFGEKMKEQVEERLKFYEEGIAPTKNLTAMQAALALTKVSMLSRSNGQILSQPFVRFLLFAQSIRNSNPEQYIPEGAYRLGCWTSQYLL